MKLKQIISRCDFILGATNVKSLPDCSIPEVAIAGRSNVGKSSLINAITRNKRIAKISSTPGCTRQINFYLIDNGFMRLVDLPGYGYSKASKNDIENYIRLMEYYLYHRENLQKVILLVDSRRSLKEIDLSFINWLESNEIFYQLVLTKTDKIKSTELNSVVNDIELQLVSLKFLLQPILAVSSKEKQGIERLVYEITSCIK